MSTWEYIYIAVGSAASGIGITFLLILMCQYFGIDIFLHIWLIAVPIVLALFLNVFIIELYHKFKRKD
jgi:hypothetical protein